VIVTVTLNPALHVDYEAEQITLGASNQITRVRHRTGGRGLAVARVLHTFGHDVIAAGLAGGSAGETIRNELARAGIATRFTRIGAESRRVVAVCDGLRGTVTGFSEPAPYITTEELGRLAADYRSLLDGATAVVLCGSLPAGLPAETYGSLASYAAGAGVPVVLDAGGSALHHGAARRPELVIPELPVTDGGGRRAALDAAGISAPDAAGGSSVVLLTNRGVIALTSEGEWSAELPATAMASVLESRNEVAGTRDALVAGFVPGIALAWSWPDTLRHAVALAASVIPSGEVDLAAYEELLPLVEVTGPRASWLADSQRSGSG